MDETDMMQFRDRFINDAKELLLSLEKSLLELENQPENQEMIENVFRVMHTLKGVSAMYGFENIGIFTHSFESIYQLVRDKKTKLTTEIFNLTFQSVDHIHNLLADAELADAQNQETHNRLLAKITHITEALNLKIPTNKKNKAKPTTKKESNIKTWYILLHVKKEFDLRGISMLNIMHDISKLGSFKISKSKINNDFDNDQKNDYWRIFLSTKSPFEDIEDALMFIIDDCKIIKLADSDLFDKDNTVFKPVKADTNKISIVDRVENKKINLASKNQSSITNNKELNKSKRITNTRISVDSDKLETLMFLVSELIITKSELQLSLKSKDFGLIAKASEKIDKLAKQFRDNALDIRLVPINDLTIKFKRLIRDLSQSLNKKIKFEIKGSETELDKNIIDRIAEPLMHILRNCIDHGIEEPALRIKRNKSATGIIKFSSYQEGDSVIIEVGDDGNGINSDIVLKKAIEKGFIPSDSKLSIKEIYNLIFLPGLSTAQSLTQVSGRGVGMDVVKNKFNELNAFVDIDSEIGIGTTFRIKLHQTIAILDTLLFKLNSMHLLVPLVDIEVCNLIETTVLESKRYTRTVPFNNELIPYIDLYKLYKLKTPTSTKIKLIVLNKNKTRFAIAADNIIGEHQAVLKSMGKYMKKQENIAGASILGDGNLAFLLDTSALRNIVA